MVTYIEAHGGETGVQVFIPGNLTLHYYAASKRTARASVTLLIEALGDGSIRPVESVRGREFDNNSLSSLSADEQSYSMSMKDPGLKIRYVGAEPALPSGILLCSRNGIGECAPARVAAVGRHTCRGLLGILHDAGEIHMMTCRNEGRNDPHQAYPANYKDYFADLDGKVAEMVDLIKTDPDKAWLKLNEMYGTPDLPVAEVKQYWADLDEAGRAQLIESQQQMILMINQNNEIRTFLDTYGDQQFLDQEGSLIFYTYYLSSNEETRKRIEKHFQETLNEVRRYVADLPAWLRSPGASWNSIGADERRQLLAIDDHDPDQPIRRLVAPAEITKAQPIDWPAVHKKSAKSLKDALDGERAWFAGIKDKPEEFLLETVPIESLISNIDNHAYDNHWATRPYEHVFNDEDNGVQCGLNVIKVDDEEVTVALIDADSSEQETVAAAVEVLNGTREITLTLVAD